MDNFWTILVIVLVAEIPCLMRSMAIQMYNKSIWNLAWATIIGNMVALALGIGLAKLLQGHMDKAWFEMLKHGTAVVLIIMGIYMIVYGT